VTTPPRTVTRFLLALCVLLSLFAAPVVASSHIKGYTKKDGTHVKAHERKAPKEHATKAPKAPKTNTAKPSSSTSSSAARDEKGRIQRSEAAKHAFARRTGHPNGRPGYVIDHIVPLACEAPMRRAICSGRPSKRRS
jgi:hypothetical protein